MQKIKMVTFGMLFCSLILTGQTNVKVMFYNLLNYPNENTFPERDNDLALILTHYQPDILMVCEVNNETGANQILNIAQNNLSPQYAAANYVDNTSDDLTGDRNELQNMLYYDNSKFTLEFQTEITTLVRDFNHYRLKLNTIDTDQPPVYLDAIVCHLKASRGDSNELVRSQMALDLMSYLSTLPIDSHVILGGDLNLYTAFESAFQVLLDDTYPISFVDPANRLGNWSNNPEFLDVFTQSTRTLSNLGGAAGGFDDRFDFILASDHMFTSTDLYYVENSYQVFGNNNNPDCYNRAINQGDCSGDLFDLNIRQSLHNFSDHLPVTIMLETPQSLSIPKFKDLATFSVNNTYIRDGVLKINTINSIDLKMINSLGQVVNYFNNLPSYSATSLDVSNLNTGMYWLVNAANTSAPIKILIDN